MPITSRAGEPHPDAVLVVIDGSPGDLPSLRWAAEEASETRRRLVIAHATGLLPPQLTFAERHVAGRQRREVGERLVAGAVEEVRSVAPEVEVDTMVRLLDPILLLPAAGAHAHTMAQSAEVWTRPERSMPHAPVMAVLMDAHRDAHVLVSAAEYAARRGLEIRILEGDCPGLAGLVREASPGTSLVFLSRPAGHTGSGTLTWPLALSASAGAQSPVVLVSA